MIILLYLTILVGILLTSPFIFVVCYPLSQLYLLYLKINTRLLLIANFLIVLFWYFCFHYYFALLIFNNGLEKFGKEVLTLNDPFILMTLLNSSLTTESIFRPLFVETCLLLNFFGENLNLTITIANIF